MSPLFRLTLAGLCLASGAAFAQLEPDQAPGAPVAIQDRAYVMMQEIDITGGFLPLDPYTKGAFVGGSYIAHFSDFVGWEIARGGYNFGVKTDLRQQLERDFGILPNAFDAPQFFAGTDLVLSPFYGKLAVTNRWVVHTEVFFTVGGTFYKFGGPTDFRLGPTLGANLRLFLNKTLSVRIGFDDSVLFSLRDAKLSNVMALSLSLGINIGASE